MLSLVGSVLVGVAWVAALYAACATCWAIRQADRRWATSGRNGARAAAALLGLALLVLAVAFLTDRFEIRYVARHSSRALPLYLKVSAVWAGQDGSLLLWSFLQALFAAWIVGRPSERARPLVPWAFVILCLITAFFVGVTLLLSNPFARMAPVPPDGQGLNPLLRHAGMIFHPPALYVGYVGLAIPFAFALAALITQRPDDWLPAAHRWALMAWLFLGLGIMLGARWAYDVLGWGGYWGWDPVENAGLMPWLTATALLHGMVMQEQHGGFRWWNQLLAISSFTLVLFGTFTTRSGLIQSVHAFARSNLGLYFLAFILLTLVGALVLLYSRRSVLSTSHALRGLLSRGGMFLLALVLLVTLAGSVLVGSLLPTLTPILAGKRFEATPAWFDRVTGPQFAALVFVMGICPLLGRVSGGGGRVLRRGWPALLGAVAVPVIAALAGFTRPISMVGFALVGLAGGTALGEIIRDATNRSRRDGERFLLALSRLLNLNLRRYGGYLVHVGVVLMALGIIGTRLYPCETEILLSAGSPVAVGDYTFLVEDLQQSPVGDRVTTSATVSVYRRGAYLTTLEPRMDRYTGIDQDVFVPALHAALREDLYLVLFRVSADGLASLKVIVNPLVNFLWLGGLVLLAGGVVALWPGTRVAHLPAFEIRRRATRTAVGLAAGLLVLVAAAVAMWGPGGGAADSRRGRPLPGQPAPDFAIDLLDGSALTLSSLRGQVVVVNFWTSWCPSCEEELPVLEAAWAEYQARGVTFVGVAVQEEESEVRAVLSQFSLSYPVGMDPPGRIAAAYGITGVPETFVVDPVGQVAYVHVGPVGAAELFQELDRLLQK